MRKAKNNCHQRGNKEENVAENETYQIHSGEGEKLHEDKHEDRGVMAQLQLLEQN
jgi:hypothetical protein